MNNSLGRQFLIFNPQIQENNLSTDKFQDSNVLLPIREGGEVLKGGSPWG